YIVITSINQPTEAVIKFAKIEGYSLIVVGDKKSSDNFNLDNCQFLSIKDQEEMNFFLIKGLPYNHYSRKMIGYLEAIKNGAEAIIDTDDDNIPYEDWSFPNFEGSFDKIPEERGFINIYKLFTTKKIWPRGLPLNKINKSDKLDEILQNIKCNVGIWQGLADEDPDVDAIYRLVDDSPCFFEKRDPVVCSVGSISPFNTQNTIIRKELFPLLYLPSTVTFRYTDILRGLIAQPIMWLYGYELGFTKATVIQKRNPHDYYKDFLSEIPMFQTTEQVIDIVKKSISKNDSIEDNLYNSYKALYENGIVAKEELYVLENWL
ncbi:MAG: STELLO glycosyltransferase family protein, partial [Paludibacter sp.]